MNFERGQDPKKSLSIGLDYTNRIPEVGRSFFVRFHLRNSQPDFYPLQKKEKNGEPIIAICKSIRRAVYDPHTFDLSASVICQVGHNEFYATMDENKCWEIA